MSKKILNSFLFLFFIGFMFNPTPVLAAGDCNKAVDTSRCVFDHTESVGADDMLEVETAGILKKVCCELGSGATKRYSCDHYAPTKQEQANAKVEGSEELTDIPCDLSDGTWTFQKSYTAPSNQSTTTKDSKICCKGNGLANGAETFRCNSYLGSKKEEEATPAPTFKPYEKGDAIGSNCGVISDLIPYIQELYNFFKIALPIALIIFGVMDFMAPILSNDKDALTKATVKFIKRCIILVAFFFVPVILKYLLGVYSEITGKDATLCGLVNIWLQNWR